MTDPDAWSPSHRAAALLLALCSTLACGSARLDTAAEPGNPRGAGAGSAGGPGDAGLIGSDAASETPGPLAPQVLVGLGDFSASYVSGPANSTSIDVSGVPFQKAWRINMPAPPATPWVAQLIVPLTEPVKAGDLLQVSFWLRCEANGANGDCYTEFIFERASDPWEKSVVFSATASAEWTQNSQFFRPLNDYGANEAHMLFRLGYATQVIDIGGLVVERVSAK